MNFTRIRADARKVILFLVTVCAVAHGILSYFWLATRLFWEEHGDSIHEGAVRFLFEAIDFSLEVYLLGKETREFVNRFTAEWSDRIYFYSCGF